jgi:serine/threonine-protein kinase
MSPDVGAVVVGRYVLRERIGGGSTGEVWRADDTQSARRVAVKVLRPGLDGEVFAATCRAVMALRDPSIVEVYGWSQANGQHYLIMRDVVGTDLATLLARQRRLAPAHVMSIVAEAASALQTVHTAGMVHGDIRPGHLLLRRDGPLVLIDIGVAAASRSTPDPAAEPPVWSAYLAPEQLLGAPATVATDVYALGAVAYACLAGIRPPTPSATADTSTTDEPPTFPDDIPDPVRTVVARAMAEDPAARWPSGAELARAAMRAASSTEATRIDTSTILRLRADGTSTAAANTMATAEALSTGASPLSVTLPEPAPSGPAYPTSAPVAADWTARLTAEDAIVDSTGRRGLVAWAAVGATAVAVLLVGALLAPRLGGPNTAASRDAPTAAGPASPNAGSGVSHVIGAAATGSTEPSPTGTTTAVASPSAPPPANANPTTAAPGPGPAPAPAPAGPEVIAVQVGAQVIRCAAPSLATGYGPIHNCTEVSGGQGRNGLYSPLTQQFNPSTDWVQVGEAVVYKLNVSANDGQTGTFVGFASLQMGYGPVVYGTQYQGNQGRFGNYNLLANAFYPSGDWTPVVI